MQNDVDLRQRLCCSCSRMPRWSKARQGSRLNTNRIDDVLNAVSQLEQPPQQPLEDYGSSSGSTIQRVGHSLPPPHPRLPFVTRDPYHSSTRTSHRADNSLAPTSTPAAFTNGADATVPVDSLSAQRQEGVASRLSPPSPHLQPTQRPPDDATRLSPPRPPTRPLEVVCGAIVAMQGVRSLVLSLLLIVGVLKGSSNSNGRNARGSFLCSRWIMLA